MNFSNPTKVYLLEYLASIYRRNQARQNSHKTHEPTTFYHQCEYNCFFENLERHLNPAEIEVFRKAYLEGVPLAHLQMDQTKEELERMKKQVGVKIFDCIYQQF